MCVLLLAACSERADPGPASTPPGSTASVLQEINYTYSVYLARYEDQIAVDPRGLLSRRVTHGKSYGPQDAPRGPIVDYKRQLSGVEIEELVRHFAAWEKGEMGAGVADGPEYSITYGNRKVQGGTLPESIAKIVGRLQDFADSAVKVDEYTPKQLPQ
jgi:hypothetical protein